MTRLVCATPGCDNPAAARQGSTGRPPIYCCPACRLALRVKRRRPEQSAARSAVSTTADEVAVEIGQDLDDATPTRSWTVTIHRGPLSVIVGQRLGRFAAAALTSDLQQLFNKVVPP